MITCKFCKEHIEPGDSYSCSDDFCNPCILRIGLAAIGEGWIVDVGNGTTAGRVLKPFFGNYMPVPE